MRTKNLSFPWLQWQVQELTVHCIALSRTNVSIPGHHTYIHSSKKTPWGAHHVVLHVERYVQ